jgi:Ala-tRNA(Pro) deacylase
MDVQSYLRDKRVAFQTTKHTPTFTAQELAATEHVRGDEVAKVVIIRGGDRFWMLVLPASCNVRLDRVEKALGVKGCRLATEEEMGRLFPDCELGAMPPFGREYNLETLADTHLAEDPEIVFESGRHDEAVRMKWADYARLAEPKIVAFAEHLH